MIENTPTYVQNYRISESLSCGVLNPVTSKTSSVTMYPGARSGSQNPMWRDQVKRGINATTDYSRSGVIVDQAEPVFYDFSAKCSQSQVNKGRSRFSGEILEHPDLSDFSGGPSFDPTSATNQAIMSFVHDAKAQYNSISGGVFLGELRETLSMIRNPAKSLRAKAQTYLDGLSGRQSRFRTKRDAESFIANSWLEASYGWMPLISDTKAGAEALARLIHGDVRHSTVRGFGKAETASTPTFSNYNVPGFTLGQKETYLISRDTCIIKGGVSAKATGPTLTNAAHLFGFTPEEFVPTIWNLIPYSFLADYFLNVGDILEATFFDRAGVSWVSRTNLQEKVFTSRVHHKRQGSSWSGSSTGGSYVVRQKSMSRSSSTPLVPSFEVSLPGAPQQWINMAALAATHRKLIPYFH